MTTLPFISATVAETYNSLLSSARNTQAYMSAIQRDLAIGPVAANTVLAALSAAQGLLALVTQLRADAVLSAGVVAYTQQQVGQPTLDVASALDASATALQALITALLAAYPQTGGVLADRQFDANGALIWVSIPAAQMQAASAAITAWFATIS
jgi:hypothetical protein